LCSKEAHYVSSSIAFLHQPNRPAGVDRGRTFGLLFSLEEYTDPLVPVSRSCVDKSTDCTQRVRIRQRTPAELRRCHRAVCPETVIT
jgi:hypothetical protein